MPRKPPSFDNTKGFATIHPALDNGACFIQDGAYFAGDKSFVSFEGDPANVATPPPQDEPEKPPFIGVDLDGDGKVDVTLETGGSKK